MADGAGKRLGVVGGLLAGVVLATGIGLYATDSPPFRDSYCWGAWQENGGARFLGEEALGKSGSGRKGTESAPPSADRPHGSCTVAVSSIVEDDDSDEPLTFDERVVVGYGPLPAAARERHAWMAQNFHGSASPLPDGLDGLVAGDRAMLVLPEACDVDGRPSVVTIHSEGWGDGHLGKLAMPFTIGAYSDVTRMLLDVANTGMAHAGCAPDEPLHTTSPLVTVAEESDSAGRPLCRIPGVGFHFGPGAQYEQQVGAVTPRLQTCSVMWKSRGEPDEPAAQYVMTGEPRMTALFGGLPEGTGQGLAHATCDGRRTVFYGHVHGGLAADKAAAERSFKNFVASVGNRIGCETGGQA
ncbi:hypothetical protein [Streptomyces peucetius]|nr:hypothetical protein CGZ69_10370 [Streptomyces peucetius subsp. caesius ATCC 27952]